MGLPQIKIILSSEVCYQMNRHHHLYHHYSFPPPSLVYRYFLSSSNVDWSDLVPYWKVYWSSIEGVSHVLDLPFSHLIAIIHLILLEHLFTFTQRRNSQFFHSEICCHWWIVWYWGGIQYPLGWRTMTWPLCYVYYPNFRDFSAKLEWGYEWELHQF